MNALSSKIAFNQGSLRQLHRKILHCGHEKKTPRILSLLAGMVKGNPKILQVYQELKGGQGKNIVPLQVCKAIFVKNHKKWGRY